MNVARNEKKEIAKLPEQNLHFPKAIVTIYSPPFDVTKFTQQQQQQQQRQQNPHPITKPVN